MKASRYFLVILALLATLSAVMSCSRGPSADEMFVGLANRYLAKVRELSPEWSTNLGDHRFDDQISDLSATGIQTQILLHTAYLDSLDRIDPTKLDRINTIDYQILHDSIEYSLFGLEEIRAHEWNPLLYNPGDGIYNLLAREFAPLWSRLLNVKARLEKLPELLAAARENLVDPPQIFTETAIQQNQGVISLVMDGLQPYLEEAPELQEEFISVRARAISALEAYGTWLEEDLLPRSTGDFRLGEELYRRKLRFALASDLTPEEILAAAEKDLVETQEAIYETAQLLFAKYCPDLVHKRPPTKREVVKTVLDRLAENHPTSATIVSQAEGCLERATRFVQEHDLMTVPDEPVRLIVMPEYQRGLYIGYCDAPGPLEERGETFYAIAPTPRDWSAERSESFYREYNNYMLENLTIHEAMPGHYLQLAHANKFEAPTLIRAIFGSGTFVEGWATYTEQLMAAAGYGGPEVKIQQLKMRLRLIINAIIDQKIHAGDMTEAEALELMMNEGYQEEGEAAGKWRRACLTSAQLSTYYVGNMEVNRIRADYEAKLGGDFDLKEFHDRLLSFGSPPPRYVRELLGL
jgi:uncharacterized protein (DUF885 family)